MLKNLRLNYYSAWNFD